MNSISVAMACYNGERYIREQLDSIAAQTLLPLELIVCDDVSTDATAEIVADFAKSAPFPVRLINNAANLGHSDNFFKAAGLCRGEWIAFCDQDDVWLPNKLARVTEAVSHHAGDELVLVAHSALVADEKLVPTGRRLPDFERDYFVERAGRFPAFCLPGFSLVCRATLIRGIDQNLRPVFSWNDDPPTMLGHDYWISVLANALGGAAYVSAPLTLWRRHDRTTSGLAQVTKHVRDDESPREELRTSLAAVKPNAYLNQASLLRSIAESFVKIASTLDDAKAKQRLLTAAADDNELANALTRRGELYRSTGYASRFSALFHLLRESGRFRRNYYSYGVKSFCKDSFFALGLLD